MIIPPSCPICSSPWIHIPNVYNSNYKPYFNLICTKCIKNKLYVSIINFPQSQVIYLRDEIKDNPITVEFYPHIIYIYLDLFKMISIPFFQPNFSNIPNLLNKLKTYITFI